MKSILNERRTIVFGASGALALAAAPKLVCAQSSEFPGTQPIRIVAPGTAGGSSDIVARLLSTHMSSQLKVPVIVENLPGAGGIVSAAKVARSDPDGRTLLLGVSSNIATAPIVAANLPYDPLRSFAPVGRATFVSMCAVSTADLPAKDLKDLVALARTRSGDSPLMYGAWGHGSVAHLTMESINFHTKAGMRMVPYKSEADVQRALIGNEVPLGPQTIGLLLPHLRSGRVRALGIAAKQRSPLLPDVPTFNEQGVPFDLSGWLGLFAPAGTPEPVLDRLANSMEFALRQPDVVERTRALGMEIETIGRQAFTAGLRAEIATWRQLADAAGVRPE